MFRYICVFINYEIHCDSYRPVDADQELSDKVVALCRARSSTNQSTSNADNEDVSKLRQELNDVYKRKALNDQQLIDTSNRLTSTEKQCAQLQKTYESDGMSYGVTCPLQV